MLFVTSHFYAWSKLFDTPQEAMRLLDVELQHPKRSSPQAIRTIARLRAIDDCKVLLDTGSTSIGRARSRVFSLACAEDCEAWVSIDDDVEASMTTLRWALEAVRTSLGICIVPYIGRRERETDRSTALVQITREQMRQRRELSNGGAVVPCTSGGFGLVFVHRAALSAISRACTELKFLDDDGSLKFAPFIELLEHENWYSEDMSFFRRVPAVVPIEALVTGETSHQGAALRLEHIEAYVQEEETPSTLRTGETDDTARLDQ